jgi:hypothetical protein
MTIQKGRIATISAVIPDGTVCSAQTTAPFPPTSRRPPTIVALFQWDIVGLTAPRARPKAYRIKPERRKRTAAMRNGGVVSTANRIARYVDPQIR